MQVARLQNNVSLSSVNNVTTVKNRTAVDNEGDLFSSQQKNSTQFGKLTVSDSRWFFPAIGLLLAALATPAWTKSDANCGARTGLHGAEKATCWGGEATSNSLRWVGGVFNKAGELVDQDPDQPVLPPAQQ